MAFANLNKMQFLRTLPHGLQTSSLIVENGAGDMGAIGFMLRKEMVHIMEGFAANDEPGALMAANVDRRSVRWDPGNAGCRLCSSFSLGRQLSHKIRKADKEVTIIVGRLPDHLIRKQ